MYIKSCKKCNAEPQNVVIQLGYNVIVRTSGTSSPVGGRACSVLRSRKSVGVVP
jgi:hypothetical protein